MIVFVIAEVIAMIAIIVWGLVLLCFNNKVNCFWLTYCCSGCAWVAHYLGTLFWLGITSANYNADCSVTPYNGKGPTVCTGDGPALALFTLIFLPVIVILFCIVGCHAQRKHNLMLINAPIGHPPIGAVTIIAPGIQPYGPPGTGFVQNVQYYSQPAPQGFSPYPPGVPGYYQYPAPGVQGYNQNNPQNFNQNNPNVYQPNFVDSNPPGQQIPPTYFTGGNSDNPKVEQAFYPPKN